MVKKPWEEKVIDDQEKLSRKAKGPLISTPLLTALLSIFFAIVVGILFVVFYTSNRGGDKTSETSHFYGASSSSASSSSTPTTTTTESTATESTTTASKGETITVLSGEGAASIASRAGISVEKLYELNPDHMTSGYWYANPGDEVYIN